MSRRKPKVSRQLCPGIQTPINTTRPEFYLRKLKLEEEKGSFGRHQGASNRLHSTNSCWSQVVNDDLQFADVLSLAFPCMTVQQLYIIILGIFISVFFIR